MAICNICKNTWSGDYWIHDLDHKTYSVNSWNVRHETSLIELDWLGNLVHVLPYEADSYRSMMVGR